MAMLFRGTKGFYAKPHGPFFVFKNVTTNFPIQRTPDNVPGYSYRTQRTAWMDRSTFDKYLRELRAIDFEPDGGLRKLFVDNASDHNQTEDLDTSIALIRRSSGINIRCSIIHSPIRTEVSNTNRKQNRKNLD